MTWSINCEPKNEPKYSRQFKTSQNREWWRWDTVLWGSLCKISGPHLSADCDSANPATSRASWKCAVCAVGKGSFGEGTDNLLESHVKWYRPWSVWMMAHRLNDSSEKRNLDLPLHFCTRNCHGCRLPEDFEQFGIMAAWPPKFVCPPGLRADPRLPTLPRNRAATSRGPGIGRFDASLASEFHVLIEAWKPVDVRTDLYFSSWQFIFIQKP